MLKESSIGVLGGMGTYATINVFRQYAEIFEATKEWDRPRIVIDNRCTMPSRVRAYLYHEDEDVLIDSMVDSLEKLVDMGCTNIILACNTSHIFLPKIFDINPKLKRYVIDIVENCVDVVAENNIKHVNLFASEGTIESRIYQKKLEERGIVCTVPKREDYAKLRLCIEAVKLNRIEYDVETIFRDMISDKDYCIWGCTELPILYEKIAIRDKERVTFDPIYLALSKVKEEINYEKNINVRGI